MSKSPTPGNIDPNGGFLCLSTHWRPNPADPDPEMPGQRLAMSSYIPVRAQDPCFRSSSAGSGKLFRDCHQRERYWHPICPNPGLRGYSLLAPQSATFRRVGGSAVHERLNADIRLQTTEYSPERGFWVCWGDPALDDLYGTLCFGDIELKHK